MENTVIVHSSIVDTRCWSAKRFLNKCEDCSMVNSCEVPCAVGGRIKLAQAKISSAQNRIQEAKARIESLLEEAAKEMAG